MTRRNNELANEDISSIGLVSLVCILLPRSLRADPILYSFAGDGIYAGTSWTYLSTSGYLTYGSLPYYPTTASNFVYQSVDYGALGEIEFFSANRLDMFRANLPFTPYPDFFTYDIGAAGTYYDQYGGTLVITDLAAVPEPSSLVLTLIGLVGLLLVSRKRIAQRLQRQIT